MNIINTIKNSLLPVNPNSKIHLQVNGEAICGQKPKTYSLQFAKEAGEATCKRCLKAVEK